MEERYRAAESELKEKRKAVVECDREVARMKKEEERMQKEVGKNEIEVKKLEHQVRSHPQPLTPKNKTSNLNIRTKIKRPERERGWRGWLGGTGE